MAFKTSGSNALQGDDSPRVEVKSGGKLVSTSSDSSGIKIRFQTENKNPGFTVINGGGTGTLNAERQNLQVVDGGKSGNTGDFSDNAPASDAGSSAGGFYHPNSGNAGSASEATDDEQPREQPAEQADEQPAEQSSDQPGDQSGEQPEGEGQENPENPENPEGNNPKNPENSNGENKEGENPDGEKKDGENPDGENPDGEKKDGENQDSDPAMNAAAGAAAAGGAAAMGAEMADDFNPQPQAPAEEPGDSGTSAAAGTNPALNQEADPNREAAKNDLRNSEDQAAGNAPKKSGDANKDAKDKEDNPDNGFKNSTNGKESLRDKVDPRRKVINKVKQWGPIGSIIAIIFGVGFGLMSLQSALPFSIANLLSTNNNSLSAPTVSRAQRVFMKQLAKKSPSSSSGGSDSDNYDVSEKQRNNLAKNGIYVVDGDDNTRMALFDDGSGKLKVVGGDDASVAALKGKLNADNLSEQLRTKYGKSGFDIDTENIDTYKSRMTNDANFETKFTKGSKTWGSSVAAWFDKRTAQFLSRNFITRNLFKKYINRVNGTDSEIDSDGGTVTKNRSLSDVVEEAESIKRKSAGGSGVEVEEQKFKSDVDADGNPVLDENGDPVNPSKDGDTPSKTNVGFGDGDGATGKTAALNKAKSSLSALVDNKGTKALSLSCLLLNLSGSAMLIASAYNIAQILPIISSFFETVDKIKSGNGNAPINEVATALVAASPALLLTADGTYTDNVNDINDSNLKAEQTESKSAMQSEALSSLIAGTKINASDEIVSSFNVGNLVANVGGSSFLSRVATAVGTASIGVGMFKTCSMFKLGQNALSVGVDIATIGLALLGPGGALAAAGVQTVKQLVTKVAVKAITAIGTAGLVSLISKLLVPRFATLFMRTVADNLIGETYGTALVDGAAIYLGRNHLFGGGSPGSRDQYLAFAAKQQEQIAKDAEYERATRSPFDYTSQYTFAGTMLRQLALLNTMSSGPVNVLSTIGTLTKNSIVAMMPTVAADANEVASNMMTESEFEATCPALASIGAYGDAFCNPYIVSDYSTMETDPEEIKDKVKSDTDDNFDSTGAIGKGSKLAHYIDYCSGRSSGFGIVDGNIANQFQVGGTGSTVGDALVGIIPVVGDMLDVMTENKKMANAGWITGETCVATYDNDNGWGTSTKYYQRYLEDERLKESIYGSTENGDTGYVSPVTAYIEQRDAENPVDNSMEGVLARYSGLTKDQVIATLDYIDYSNYIAKYDPSECYPFGEDSFILPSDIYFEIQDSGTVFAANFLPEVIFADIRNRLSTTA
ncbi:hypothetical protein IKX64_00875 [Candidatus Saccharibacteria bacterium]|nr:hypothetical protein [Candidatus Saccharibacteria bacterium]